MAKEKSKIEDEHHELTEFEQSERELMDNLVELKDWGFADVHCHQCGISNGEIGGRLLQCAICRNCYWCSDACFEKIAPKHDPVCQPYIDAPVFIPDYSNIPTESFKDKLLDVSGPSSGVRHSEKVKPKAPIAEATDDDSTVDPSVDDNKPDVEPSLVVNDLFPTDPAQDRLLVMYTSEADSNKEKEQQEEVIHLLAGSTYDTIDAHDPSRQDRVSELMDIANEATKGRVPKSKPLFYKIDTNNKTHYWGTYDNFKDAVLDDDIPREIIIRTSLRRFRKAGEDKDTKPEMPKRSVDLETLPEDQKLLVVYTSQADKATADDQNDAANFLTDNHVAYDVLDAADESDPDRVAFCDELLKLANRPGEFPLFFLVPPEVEKPVFLGGWKNRRNNDPSSSLPVVETRKVGKLDVPDFDSNKKYTPTLRNVGKLPLDRLSPFDDSLLRGSAGQVWKRPTPMENSARLNGWKKSARSSNTEPSDEGKKSQKVPFDITDAKNKAAVARKIGIRTNENTDPDQDRLLVMYSSEVGSQKEKDNQEEVVHILEGSAYETIDSKDPSLQERVSELMDIADEATRGRAPKDKPLFYKIDPTNTTHYWGSYDNFKDANDEDDIPREIVIRTSLRRFEKTKENEPSEDPADVLPDQHVLVMYTSQAPDKETVDDQNDAANFLTKHNIEYDVLDAADESDPDRNAFCDELLQLANRPGDFPLFFLVPPNVEKPIFLGGWKNRRSDDNDDNAENGHPVRKLVMPPPPPPRPAPEPRQVGKLKMPDFGKNDKKPKPSSRRIGKLSMDRLLPFDDSLLKSSARRVWKRPSPQEHSAQINGWKKAHATGHSVDSNGATSGSNCAAGTNGDTDRENCQFDIEGSKKIATAKARKIGSISDRAKMFDRADTGPNDLQRISPSPGTRRRFKVHRPVESGDETPSIPVDLEEEEIKAGRALPSISL